MRSLSSHNSAHFAYRVKRYIANCDNWHVNHPGALAFPRCGPQRVRRARRELLSRARLTPVPSIFPDDWDIQFARRLGSDKPKRMSPAHKRSIEKPIEEVEFGPTLADCAARLVAMDRYERRALSRRKFAIREFDAARQALA